MYEGIPVPQVGQQGVQGPNIQVGCLSQREACADGPVIHSPLQAVIHTLQGNKFVNQMLLNQGDGLYPDGCQAQQTHFR